MICLVDDKLQWEKSNKIDGRVCPFLDGTDEEAATVALQRAFSKFGRAMWLQQDEIDEQIKIDAAYKKRKLNARNSVGDLSSTSTLIERLSGLILADGPSPESAKFAASAMKCYEHSQ